jgi:hypothetical protein
MWGHLPFVGNVVKHTVRNYRSNEYSMAFHGKAPSTVSPVDLKSLHDVNPVKTRGYPAFHEAMMYGFGHGCQKLPNDPAILRQGVSNRRTLAQVDAMDISNYYKCKK